MVAESSTIRMVSDFIDMCSRASVFQFLDLDEQFPAGYREGCLAWLGAADLFPIEQDAGLPQRAARGQDAALGKLFGVLAVVHLGTADQPYLALRLLRAQTRGLVEQDHQAGVGELRRGRLGL